MEGYSVIRTTWDWQILPRKGGRDRGEEHVFQRQLL